jgi:hypothetical protein
MNDTQYSVSFFPHAPDNPDSDEVFIWGVYDDKRKAERACDTLAMDSSEGGSSKSISRRERISSVPGIRGSGDCR